MFEASFYLYLLKIGDNLYLLADYYVLFLTRSTIAEREREIEKWAHLKICKKSMRSVLLFPTIDQLVDMELLTLLAEKNATFNRA